MHGLFGSKPQKAETEYNAFRALPRDLRREKLEVVLKSAQILEWVQFQHKF
jgi:hypothetical protein